MKKELKMILNNKYRAIFDADYFEEMKQVIKYRERRKRRFWKKDLGRIRIISSVQPMGIFSACLSYINSICYAVENGYTPVIDEKNRRNSIGCFELIDKENCWDFFFEQPVGISLDAALNSSDITYVNAFTGDKPQKIFNWLKYSYGKDNEYWSPIINKYIRLNSECRKYVEEKYEQLNIEGKKVLGVSVRRGMQWGAAKRKAHFNCHPTELPLDKELNEIKKIYELGGYAKIFFASDDCESIEIIKKAFGNDAIFIERERIDFYSNGKASDELKCRRDKGTRELLTRDYIAEIYCLSKCSGLYGGRNGGTLMADIWKGRPFDEYYIAEKRAISHYRPTKYEISVSGAVVKH